MYLGRIGGFSIINGSARTLLTLSVLSSSYFNTSHSPHYLSTGSSTGASTGLAQAFSMNVMPPNKTKNSDIALDLKFQNSWIQQLVPETNENYKKSLEQEGLLTDAGSDNDNNRTRRPVYNGHYVLVKPTGLKNPKLLLVSQNVAQDLLQLDENQVQSEEFLNYVSGNFVPSLSWATPYALSIVGTRYTNNCPYGTGDGYGDGRAISIGEFQNHELQLKGAGKTPFCRGADGRAVLRSSIREFLASEAMHHLGIRTTRALSLVVSEDGGDTTNRPWYTNGAKISIPDMDDARLAQYSVEERRTILAQLRDEKADPNVMIVEKCAMTCRVCTSFCRIGHVDLFARRVEKVSQQNYIKTNERYDTSTLEWAELEKMIWHSCFREFRETAYTPFHEKGDLESAATELLKQSADRLSTMVTEWIRVGFAQGNFNADNCLIGGHTMDYGPFGWMEEYSPTFAKWTGSGKHFGFMNQPNAGYANYQILVESVVPVICAARGLDDPNALVDEFMKAAQPLFEEKVNKVMRRKMGFSNDNEAADLLYETLAPLMRISRVDWTLFWRQLTQVAAEYDDYSDDNYEAMLEILISDGKSSPFYEPLSTEQRDQYLEWMKRWRDLLSGEDGIAERMRMANPKYVLREWMLVGAYNPAGKGDYDELNDLFALIQSPYEEGTAHQEEKYYRRAPEESEMTGGTAFMS